MKKIFKTVLKILKWVLIIFIVLIVLFFIVRFIGQRINNKTPKGGINETMYVDINGTKQWINIYGQDKDNPVLLYLHGGPGQPTSYEDYPVLRKLSDIYIVICYSLTVLILGDALVCFVSNFVTTEEIMILQAVQMLCIVWFAFLLVAGLGTIHEYGLGGNLASIVMSAAAAAIILFIGVLLFTMLERMFSFFTSVGQELMRRL